MSDKIFTIEEITELARPVFVRNNIARAGLFGSYFKNQATAKSDIDFVVELNTSLFKLCALVDDLENTFDKHCDVLTFASLKKDGGRLAQEIERGIKIVHA